MLPPKIKSKAMLTTCITAIQQCDRSPGQGKNKKIKNREAGDKERNKTIPFYKKHGHGKISKNLTKKHLIIEVSKGAEYLVNMK